MYQLPLIDWNGAAMEFGVDYTGRDQPPSSAAGAGRSSLREHWTRPGYITKNGYRTVPGYKAIPVYKASIG